MWITQEFLGLRIGNFQSIIVIWIRTYREIFKSTLVYLWIKSWFFILVLKRSVRKIKGKYTKVTEIKASRLPPYCEVSNIQREDNRRGGVRVFDFWRIPTPFFDLLLVKFDKSFNLCKKSFSSRVDPLHLKHIFMVGPWLSHFF